MKTGYVTNKIPGGTNSSTDVPEGVYFSNNGAINTSNIGEQISGSIIVEMSETTAIVNIPNTYNNNLIGYLGCYDTDTQQYSYYFIQSFKNQNNVLVCNLELDIGASYMTAYYFNINTYQNLNIDVFFKQRHDGFNGAQNSNNITTSTQEVSYYYNVYKEHETYKKASIIGIFNDQINTNYNNLAFQYQSRATFQNDNNNFIFTGLVAIVQTTDFSNGISLGAYNSTPNAYFLAPLGQINGDDSYTFQPIFMNNNNTQTGSLNTISFSSANNFGSEVVHWVPGPFISVLLNISNVTNNIYNGIGNNISYLTYTGNSNITNNCLIALGNQGEIGFSNNKFTPLSQVTNNSNPYTYSFLSFNTYGIENGVEQLVNYYYSTIIYGIIEYCQFINESLNGNVNTFYTDANLEGIYTTSNGLSSSMTIEATNNQVIPFGLFIGQPYLLNFYKRTYAYSNNHIELSAPLYKDILEITSFTDNISLNTNYPNFQIVIQPYNFSNWNGNLGDGIFNNIIEGNFNQQAFVLPMEIVFPSTSNAYDTGLRENQANISTAKNLLHLQIVGAQISTYQNIANSMLGNGLTGLIMGAANGAVDLGKLYGVEIPSMKMEYSMNYGQAKRDTLLASNESQGGVGSLTNNFATFSVSFELPQLNDIANMISDIDRNGIILNRVDSLSTGYQFKIGNFVRLGGDLTYGVEVISPYKSITKMINERLLQGVRIGTTEPYIINGYDIFTSALNMLENPSTSDFQSLMTKGNFNAPVSSQASGFTGSGVTNPINEISLNGLKADIKEKTTIKEKNNNEKHPRTYTIK